MAVIVTRAGKGSPLTNAEVDANFTNLNAGRFETIPVVINAAAPTPPPAPISAGTAIQVVGVTGVSPLIEINGFGIQGQFAGRRANGTAAAPTPINSSDILAVFNARGYDANGWAAGPSASMVVVADENFTPAGHGAELQFFTTKIGTNAQVGRWQIGNDGNLNPLATGLYDIGQAAQRIRTLFGTTGDFSGQLTINTSGVIPLAGPLTATSPLRLIGNGPNGSRIEFDVFGAGAAFVGRRASGTPDAPTAVKANDFLLSLNAFGYGATAFSAGPRAQVIAFADEDWTDAAQGTRLDFYTSPVGAAVSTKRWTIGSAGHLTPFVDNTLDIGSPTARVRNVTAFQGTFSGPVYAGPNSTMSLIGGATNAILYFDNTAANAALLYDKGLNQFQFFGPTSKLTINGADGTLRTPGSVTANALSAGPSGMMQIAGTAGVNSVIYFDAVTAGKPAYFTYNFPGNTLDLVLAGTHVAAFNPADQSLTVDGTIRALVVTAVGPGSGSSVLNPGGPGNSGYLSFFDPANTRIGYFGFADTATKTINIAAEAGYAYRFGQGFSTAGEITFGASFDLVEPRGRYWNRPAPSTSFTLDLNYAGALGVCVSATPTTITIPPQSAVPWKSWTRMDFVQYGAGQVTFAPGAGVTLNATGGKRKTTGPLSAVSLIQINPDEWLLVGDLAL